MKILINALSARRGGGQTYLQHLLNKFPVHLAHEIILIAPDSLETPLNHPRIRRWNLSPSLVENPFFRTFWETWILPRKIKEMEIDILFCPGGMVNGSIPTSCRVVTTFQNMLPFSIKQRKKYSFGYMRFRNWMLEKKLLQSMIRSDLVIFISNYAESFIRERSKNKIKKGVVIPHGTDPAFRRDIEHRLAKPTWLPEKYLLYVSILDVYKAQVEVVQAYSMLKAKEPSAPPLLLIGAEYEPYGKRVRDAIASSPFSLDIILKSAIPHSELPAVYQHADINIFASEVENCPFILLEALAAGRPLVVSSCPPMPEFGGDSVLYFDPAKPQDLAEKLMLLLQDASLQKDLAERARQKSFLYDWDQSGEKSWRAILNLSH